MDKVLILLIFYPSVLVRKRIEKCNNYMRSPFKIVKKIFLVM